MTMLPVAKKKNDAEWAASRVSGLIATAETRAHQLKTRFVIAAIGTIILWAAVSYVFAAIWFTAVIVSQAADMNSWKPFRDPSRRTLPSNKEWVTLCVSSVQAALIYSGFPVLLWFAWGLQGKIFAMIWLCGALLHVTMHMHHEKRTFFAAATPHILYFLALPISSLITGAEPGRAGSAVILIAGFLYMGHLAVAFRQYQATSSTMRSASEQAVKRQKTAEHASSAKSTFLANMSHEIRTPMNGILGMAAALEKSDLNSEQSQQLKIIRDSGDLLMNVLNDLLDFSKIEANHIEIEQAPFRLCDVVRKVENLHGLKAEERGIEFSSRCDGDCETLLLGDEHRILQILHNLVGNAIKFTDTAGSVTVRIDVAPGETPSRNVAIEVVDTGIGVTPEQAARIFEPFTQADAATTRKFGGTGLGLSIVKGLIDAMDGTVSMESDLGKGSRFLVGLSLPVAPAVESEETKSAPTAAFTEVNGLRILAAEDNIVNQAVLRTFLAQRDHDVHFASNGLEAVDAFKRQEFDLVLMDISMPVLDGVEAMRQIRFLERDRMSVMVPIIAVSAHAMRQQIDDYLAAGFVGYLTKPLCNEDLHAEIDRVMAMQSASSDSSQVA